MITHETSLDQFHRQLQFVLNGYTPHKLNAKDFRNVIMGGLGGSGIGARIARLAFYTSFPVPVEVFSEYLLPGYAGKDTLVILSSYSGNTEETLAMYEDASRRQCSIIVLSSGGTITEWARRDGHPVYRAEAGFQPRMALGYSLTTLLLILGELAGIDMKPGLQGVADSLENNSALKSRSEELFQAFSGTVRKKFVVVCDLAFEAAAIRFCQQIQENAKAEAFVSVIPEANHNMIESYYEKRDTNFLFVNSGLNDRNTLRFAYLKEVLGRNNNVVFEYKVPQFNLLAMFEFIHVTDWLSIKVSNALGADNMNVQIISGLKEYLDSHRG